jgi:hypothetical protein
VAYEQQLEIVENKKLFIKNSMNILMEAKIGNFPTLNPDRLLSYI